MWGSRRKAQEFGNTNVRISAREKRDTRQAPERKPEMLFPMLVRSPIRFSLWFSEYSQLGGTNKSQVPRSGVNNARKIKLNRMKSKMHS